MSNPALTQRYNFRTTEISTSEDDPSFLTRRKFFNIENLKHRKKTAIVTREGALAADNSGPADGRRGLLPAALVQREVPARHQAARGCPTVGVVDDRVAVRVVRADVRARGRVVRGINTQQHAERDPAFLLV